MYSLTFKTQLFLICIQQKLDVVQNIFTVYKKYVAKTIFTAYFL